MTHRVQKMTTVCPDPSCPPHAKIPSGYRRVNIFLRSSHSFNADDISFLASPWRCIRLFAECRSYASYGRERRSHPVSVHCAGAEISLGHVVKTQWRSFLGTLRTTRARRTEGNKASMCRSEQVRTRRGITLCVCICINDHQKYTTAPMRSSATLGIV